MSENLQYTTISKTEIRFLSFISENHTSLSAHTETREVCFNSS